ncbi:MAG: MarR family transcriptional regulator [Actinobacteria bacterium]|nr:MarR family transcriptional regulator [Actinomycetota bacterium]MSY17641.1 MarR family transcriptional regulator [Actinomycetota bacterium]MSY41490.1 MarR family transcriptional regulator [Actinomycetota bacterium]
MSVPVPRLAADPIAEAHRQWVAHGWESAADGMAAITSLMRAHQIFLARVETVLRPFDVSFARYEVLMLLHFSKRGALPMRTIGSRLQVHQTSVTNAVDRLEAAHLVQRLPHPTDRRATLVELTRSGRALAEKATAALNAEVFTDTGLSPRAVNDVVKTLSQLRRSAGDF